MIARFPLDGLLISLLTLLSTVVFVASWLHDHPQHNPWAPLSLDDPPGWATRAKLVRLRDDPAECRAVLARSDITFTALPPLGAGQCRREDRLVVPDALPLSPSRPDATCAVHAALVLWLRQAVQPAARDLLGSSVRAVEHYGTHSCRRIGAGPTGTWSEHATGNAIDIAGFVLADGRRIVVARHWNDGGDNAEFLHRVRDQACGVFATVLSPDYNAAHADHLHFDQAGRGRGWTFCR